MNHNTLKELMAPPDDPYRIFHYCIFILGERWHEREHIILQNVEWIAAYAIDVIKDRWPEAEPHIVKTKWAYSYAMFAIKDRWPEAEPYIVKDPKTSFWYAKNLMDGQWEEAEKLIMQDPEYAYIYAYEIERCNKQEYKESLLHATQDE